MLATCFPVDLALQRRPWSEITPTLLKKVLASDMIFNSTIWKNPLHQKSGFSLPIIIQLSFFSVFLYLYTNQIQFQMNACRPFLYRSIRF